MIDTKKPGVRGRPRSFDADKAVDTAMRLFHSRGYDGVGVAELVAALGVKPPSFYAAYGSKLGLFERVIERYSGSEVNVFTNALAKGGNVAAVIAETFRNAARYYPESGGVAGCLVIDGARNSSDPEARALTLRAQNEGRDAFAAFIATEFPDRAGALADYVSITLAGMSAAARDGRDAATLTAHAEMAIRAFAREAEIAD